MVGSFHVRRCLPCQGVQRLKKVARHRIGQPHRTAAVVGPHPGRTGTHGVHDEQGQVRVLTGVNSPLGVQAARGWI